MSEAIEPRLEDDHAAQAHREAVRRVRDRVASTDLIAAAARGGLTVCNDGAVEVMLLGRLFQVGTDAMDIVPHDRGRMTPVEELLILRYLEVKCDVEPVGEDITFRDLPGGSFYAPALAKRTSDRIVSAFGHNAERLRHALCCYPHTLLSQGDVSARIYAIGRIDVTVVFHEADDEFPASAQILYDRVIASVYSSDEVAALTTGLVAKLLK